MGLTAAVLLFKFEPGNEKHTRYNTPEYIHMSVQISCSYTVRIYKVPRILPPSLRVAVSVSVRNESVYSVYSKGCADPGN